jgi:HSP20 family protein
MFYTDSFFRNELAKSFDVCISDDKDKVSIIAEVPGILYEKFNIEADKNILTIEYEKENFEKDKVLLNEINYGKFKRSFKLHNDFNMDEIKASYKNGILKIEIPKIEKSKKIIPITM